MTAPKFNFTAPAPFHFSFRPDLMDELCADDLFRKRPSSIEEAHRMGRHFGSKYNPNDAFASMEELILKYTGPRDRYIFIITHHKDSPDLSYTLGTANLARVGIERYGLLDQRGIYSDIGGPEIQSSAGIGGERGSCTNN